MSKINYFNVLPLVRGILGTHDLIPEASDLKSLGLDSLRSIDLIGAVEKRFDIAFADEEVLEENFNTIAAIVAIANRAEARKTVNIAA